jgi:AIPR protein
VPYGVYVRGWEGYNTINEEIRETLVSNDKDRFVLMNNGITIIAKSLLTTGDKFTMGDFQIVNGCQTSNVLYDNRDQLTEAVRIPIRIIFTTDDAVAEAVITATNRQTEVKQEQFFALKDFSKKLEAFFRSFDLSKRLYYERRTHQYDSANIDKTRIIVHKDLVRAVGAMFFQEPHRTVRSYKDLAARVGRNMFLPTDRPEPYYVSGLALYRLNSAFNTGKLPTALKIARYQIILTARLLIDPDGLPRMNANEMEKKCSIMMDRLWGGGSDKLLADAAERFQSIVGGNMDRDYIHTQGVTDLILEAFGHRKVGSMALNEPRDVAHFSGTVT